MRACDVDYLAQSMYEPDKFIVPGFNPGMPAINKPPIGLTDQEILCVIAFLQSLGGKPSVTLTTTHQYHAAPAGAGPYLLPSTDHPLCCLIPLFSCRPESFRPAGHETGVEWYGATGSEVGRLLGAHEPVIWLNPGPFEHPRSCQGRRLGPEHAS